MRQEILRSLCVALVIGLNGPVLYSSPFPEEELPRLSSPSGLAAHSLPAGEQQPNGTSNLNPESEEPEVTRPRLYNLQLLGWRIPCSLR